MLYRVSTTLAFLFFKYFSSLEVVGREYIPAKKSFIIASNHLSNLDPPLIASVCPRQLVFVAKNELFRNKLFSSYLKAVGAVSIERGKSSVQSIRILIKALAKKPILIFPEGSRGASFKKVYKGIGFICEKAKTPVIAAKISGTDKILPPGKVFPKRAKIKLIFKPIDNITATDSPEAITEKVVNTIKDI